MARSRTPSPQRPLAQLQELLPSPPLLLRSALLALVLLTSVGIAIAAWVPFYAQLRTGSLGGRERVWLQYGRYQPPYAHVPLSSSKYDLTSGQAYDVTLEMTVPAVQRNLELGNFMVTLELRDQSGQSLQTVSRPATLVHPAPPSLFSLLSPTRFISAFIFSSPHTSAETQHIRVPLLDAAMLSNRRAKTSEAWLQVGRQDAHPSLERAVAVAGPNSLVNKYGQGELQVYEAWLSFNIRLKGIRYFIHRFPILSFLLFVPTFTLCEFFAALLGWAAYLVFVAKDEDETLEKPSPHFPPAPGFGGGPRIKKEEEDESSEDFRPILDPFDAASREEREAREVASRGAAGIVGMTGVEQEEESDFTETEEASEESWQGVEGAEILAAVKDEDDTVTLGRSETTRATISTFGPSLAGTSLTASTSRTTATGPSSSGVRARTGRTDDAEEDLDGKARARD